MQLLNYFDEYDLLKAVLEPTVFLNWCSTQACLNLQYNLPISQDMLTGHGQYIDPVSQGTIGQ